MLAHGDNCVVTARKPEAVAELVAQYPDTAVAEPGPFGTDFYSRSLDVNESGIADYADTAGTRKVRQDNVGKVGRLG